MSPTNLVTFVIPVRHPDNASDWCLLKANLAQTVISISNQTNSDWRGIIVANDGADLPELPKGFDVVRVSFPPNDLHDINAANREAVYEAFRADKGRRVLAGMLAARSSDFFMIVDDDDLVSARIVQYASQHRSANGWKVNRGYIWDAGGRLLLGYDEFDRICGTSLIVRSDLYGLPEKFENASLEWIKSMLGSHVRLVGILADRDTPLAALPFRGAIYRVAHGGSHSHAPSLLVKYFLSREALGRPTRLLRRLGDLRFVTRSVRREFFGGRSLASIRSTDLGA